MARYFIQVLYKGTNYAGFQIQQNANSIQAEVQKALKIFFKVDFELTCSSRTDAGVHALNNYFHFDAENMPANDQLGKAVYNLNAIIPADIVIKRIFAVPGDYHCRFTAIAREYTYKIYQQKDPFLAETAFFYPFKLNIEGLIQAAGIVKEYSDFTSFSKRNTQVKNFNCSIYHSHWKLQNGLVIYEVKANRFLRGMVRGLVGTMLRVGTGKISCEDFRKIIDAKDCSKADFSVPPQGLFLMNVIYP